MVIARSTRERIPYVLEAERQLPPEQQTTFYLAVLPNWMMLNLLQLMQEAKHDRWVLLALTAGLRGWDNFRDEDGHETPFVRETRRRRNVAGVDVPDPVAEASLNALPSSLLFELANAIVSANQLTGDDAKN
jgi:hypothetical protein